MKTSVRFFREEYVTFFRQLKNNNNKNWFSANKETYLKFVDIPFMEFIEHLLVAIQKSEQSINLNANEAIFRINRDLRFSTEKTPYKTFKSALISEKGRRAKQEPGFYLEIGAEHIKMACGCFKLTPSELKLIENHMNRVNVVCHDPTFVSYIGKPIKTKNSLTFETNLSIDLINSEDLDVLVLTHWQIMNKVIKVFKNILTHEN